MFSLSLVAIDRVIFEKIENLYLRTHGNFGMMITCVIRDMEQEVGLKLVENFLRKARNKKKWSLGGPRVASK